MNTIEKYAVDLVQAGAEHTSTDDTDEEGVFADESHWRAARDLARRMAAAIKKTPELFLAWFNASGDLPYSSDEPAAVHGPWQAVLIGSEQDGHNYLQPVMTIGFAVWMTNHPAWAYTGAVYDVAIVRGSARPTSLDENGVGAMPTTYLPHDVLYEHRQLSSDAAVDRWAQARLVAALLNTNEQRLATPPQT